MPKRSDNFTRSDEHNARGIELADRGWFQEAISEFKKALDLDPRSAHAYDNLASLYSELGELKIALEYYLKAIEVDPDNPDTHHCLAGFLARYGTDLSNQEYRQAIDLSSAFPEAHLCLAINLADAGQLESALSQLEIAIRLAPDDLLIRHELASVLMDLGHLPAAIKHLKSILSVAPDSIEALVDLGLAYTTQGFHDQAEQTLQLALKLDPTDFATHYALCALYAVSDRLLPALRHAQIASQADSARFRLWASQDKMFRNLEHNENFIKLIN